MGGISIWQLLIILLIVVLLFGTKRLKGIGADLGSALKGFKKAVSDEDADFKEQQSVEHRRETPSTKSPSQQDSKEKS